MKWNGTDTRSFHTFHSFEQVEVGKADIVTWGCTKTRKNLPAFRPPGKLNEIWIYLKLKIKKWHVVPSWWSIIEAKTTNEIDSSDIHWGKFRKTSWKMYSGDVVISGCSLLTGCSLPATYPRGSHRCLWLHCSICFPLPSTGELPQLEPNEKTP